MVLKIKKINNNAEKLITRSDRNGPVTIRMGKSMIKYDAKFKICLSK